MMKDVERMMKDVRPVFEEVVPVMQEVEREDHFEEVRQATITNHRR